MKTSTTLFPAFVALAHSHATFQQLWRNGEDLESTCARLPASNSPVEIYTGTALQCNVNPAAASGKCAFAAGDTVTVEMHAHNTRDCSIEAFGGAHWGPVLAYLGKVDDAAKADGSGEFFKIYENTWKKNPSAAQGDSDYWGTKDLNYGCGKLDFKIPSDIAPGDYLLRAEAIALHAASSTGGAQHYMTCYQITVTGSGSATPSGVKFPEAYSKTGPGLGFNIHQDLSEYPAPGPALIAGGTEGIPQLLTFGTVSGVPAATAVASKPASSKATAPVASPTATITASSVIHPIPSPTATITASSIAPPAQSPTATITASSVPLDATSEPPFQIPTLTANLPSISFEIPTGAPAVSFSAEFSYIMPSDILPSIVLPTVIVPTNVLPTNIVPTNILPTVIEPTATVSFEVPGTSTPNAFLPTVGQPTATVSLELPGISTSNAILPTIGQPTATVSVELPQTSTPSAVLPTVVQPTTLVTSARPAPSPSAGIGTIKEWSRCGGIGFEGTETCASGLTCKELNTYYFQCQKGEGVQASPVASVATQPSNIAARTYTVDTFVAWLESQSGSAAAAKIRRLIEVMR